MLLRFLLLAFLRDLLHLRLHLSFSLLSGLTLSLSSLLLFFSLLLLSSLLLHLLFLLEGN